MNNRHHRTRRRIWPGIILTAAVITGSAILLSPTAYLDKAEAAPVTTQSATPTPTVSDNAYASLEAISVPKTAAIYISADTTDASTVTAPPYTEQDVVLLSKMIYGEARGLNAQEQALCIWTVLNRLADGRFGDSISAIVTAPHQFVGYREKNPVTPAIKAVVEDTLQAWANGAIAPTDAPYAVTHNYKYFTGHGGHNWFK